MNAISANNYFNFYEFFTSALTGGFSLEIKWQQVLSDFLDSSKYPPPISVELSSYGSRFFL